MGPIKITLPNKIFFLVFFLLLTLSVVSAYYKYMVLEDYEVFVEYDDEGNIIDID